jgi:flagellar protein FliO/FliZ
MRRFISLSAVALPSALCAAEQTAPSATGAMLQSFFALLLVLAVIAGAAWLLKRTQQLQRGGSHQVLKNVSAIAVGAKERVVVVEVGDTWLVLGVAPGQVQTLHTLAKQELPAGGVPMAPKFSEWLARARKGRI